MVEILEITEAINEENWWKQFYRWEPVGGTIKSVKGITLGKVNRYIEKYYKKEEINKKINIYRCQELSYIAEEEKFELEEELPLPNQDEKPMEINVTETENPMGLFSPTTGLGWESYINTRLENELKRAISSEIDLSINTS